MRKIATLKITVPAAIVITVSCLIYLSCVYLLPRHKAEYSITKDETKGFQTDNAQTDDSVAVSGNIYFRIYKCENPMSNDLRQEILSVLGIDKYAEPDIIGPDNAQVYLLDSGSVSVQTDGTLKFSNPDSNILTLFSDVYGDAELEIDRSSSENGKITEIYEYKIGGAKVMLANAAAATATYENGVLTEFTMLLRSFTVLNEIYAMLLPNKPAQSASGYRAILCYIEEQEGYVTPVWMHEKNQP